MPYRKRRNTDEGCTNKVLATNRELDEYSGKLIGNMELCKRWWLHMQQINEEEKEGDVVGSEKRAN